MKKKMMLFVWEECFTDYTDGLAFAIAHDVDEARGLVAEAFTYEPGDLMLEPKVYPLTEPIAKAVFGGS